MKMKKLKFILALYLTLCTVFNAVMFSYIIAYASTGDGMTQEEIDRANGLYGEGNWSYDSKNDLVVPTEDAQKNLGDFFLTGFGVARKAAGDGLDWCKTHMQDIINKNFDFIAIKNDLLYIPEKCLDELHDSLKNNANLTKLQGYFFLEQNMTKNEILSLYTSKYPEQQSNYDNFVDSCDNIIVSDSDDWIRLYSFDHNGYVVDRSTKVDRVSYCTYDSSLSSYMGYKYGFGVHSNDWFKETSPTWSTGGYSIIGYYGVPLRIFYTMDDFAIYLRQLKGIGSQNLYISQDFYNYKSSALNINIDKYQSTNWTTQNENIYNEIIYNRNETMVNNNVDVLTDVDFQTIIDTTIKKYMYQTGGGSGGGGTGGGGSGGTLVIPEEIQNMLEQIYSVLLIISAWIEPIYGRVGDILIEIKNLENELFLVRLNNIVAELKNIIKAINDLDFTGSSGSIDISDSIQTLIDFLESQFTELFKILKSFDFDSGGKSIFDYFLEWLLNQADHFGNFLDTFLGNLLADIIMFFIGDGGLSDAVIVPARALASEAKSRFPTSIPWDIVAIIGVFSATPETPYFELPFSIPKLGIDEKIVIDFEKAENLGKLSRSMFEIIFLLFLVIQTRKLYGSVNSN